ncbi:M28 family peptidase [Actinosynnema sp. CS-041913]|uniref:M28 family peptidase n=1 Tax=Actinosynnema sp. CS-041913 TaxID=3239917 RepID=UPI003D923878
MFAATRTRRVAAVVGAAVVALGLVAPSAQAAGSPADKLVRDVSVTDLNRHLIAFQRIADRNGGTRADPTPGFQETVGYVRGKLTSAGFDVHVQDFTYQRRVIDAAVVQVGATRADPTPLDGSLDTPVGGLTGPLAVIPPDDTPGCDASDYAGRDVRGAIVLLKRGVCTFTVKQNVAAALGAKAVVVYNYAVGNALGYMDPAQAKIPIVMVGMDAGAALVTQDGVPATVDVRRHYEPTVSRNLIAQTRTGRTDNVITLGGHLDSFRAGPGINENASSIATVLELALKLGPAPEVDNAVRFAFWGGDPGNSGSVGYLPTLSFEEQLDIALYLDVQAVGSSNGGYFVYDGDNSDGFGVMPYGSAQIERAYQAFFASRGIPTEGTNVAGAGDYSNFIAAGIPTGGPYAGIQLIKTPAQQAKWGGVAGLPFDPCHDAACDNLGNIDRTILHTNADSIAFVAGTYAMSTEDVNGVPSRAARAKARSAAQATATARGTATSATVAS